MQPIRVLFVCMGNICRSPMAEAVFRDLAGKAGLGGRFEVDSAGTGGWHAGEPPHRGTLAVLRRNGVDPGGQRARQLRAADLQAFDYVVAMDEENLDDIALLQAEARRPVSRLLDYAAELGVRDVPDPYYDDSFERVYALVTAGCAGLLRHIRVEHDLEQ
jgi:protein-tyrosine phosphatase